MTNKVNLMEALEVSLARNPHNLTAALETLVDAHGLDSVLLDLAGICFGKADHIRTNWQDEKLAKVWEKAGLVCDKASAKVEV